MASRHFEYGEVAWRPKELSDICIQISDKRYCCGACAAGSEATLCEGVAESDLQAAVIK
jgi:hypothetical protein